MKIILTALIFITFLRTFSQAESTTKQIISANVSNRPIDKNAEAAAKTVLGFLKWYQSNFQELKQIRLVNQEKESGYRVDFQNSERYLAFLKTSHLLSNGFLNEWRVYFNERDEGFRLSPQTEGIPTGFEYDLILLSQNPEKVLVSLNMLKINRQSAFKEKATVQLRLLDEYEFRLVKKANEWVINEILNLSQE